uniref:Uncharacterized protein n=1 Tax=Arundo donax TaxID=35708 RepID=A0A0A9G123_ARUDO
MIEGASTGQVMPR